MEMLDAAPTLPRYTDEGQRGLLLGRRPSLWENLGASASEGLWNTTLGTMGAVGREVAGERADPRPLSREEWEASGLAREGLRWDERMTRGRAEAMARTFDENAYRRQLQAARDPGALEMVLGFGAQLVGSIPDPVNFVPLAGPVAGGLRAAGALRASTALTRPGVAASALRGTVDAVGGNLLAAPLVYSIQARYGEEIGFDRVIGDIAISALIGAGFGTVGGLLSSRRIQPDSMAAVRTLDAAARDVAAGRPMEMPGEMAARTVEDAAMRSAPPEFQGVRLADLPTGPGGFPLTRGEFDALLAARGAPSTLRRDLLSSVARVEADADGRFRLLEQAQPFTPEQAPPAAPRAPTRAEQVRAPVLDADGQPIVAMSRDEARVLAQRLQRSGEQDVEFLRVDGQPGAYAVAAVPDAAVYRGQDGAPRVYPSAARAKAAARQIEGFGWTPVEVDGGFVLMRAAGDMGTRLQANRRLVDIGGDVLAPPRAASPEAEVMRLEDAMRADAYAWYLEALDARMATERMAAPMPVREATAPGEAARGQPERAADAADPDLATVEAMRREGRLTDADEAILRAAAEQADELEAVANGLEEAGACLLRNIA